MFLTLVQKKTQNKIRLLFNLNTLEYFESELLFQEIRMSTIIQSF